MIDIITDNLSVLIVILPLFVAFVLPTISKKVKLVEYMAILVGVLLLVAVGYLTYIVLGQKGKSITYNLGGWPAPWGIELKTGSLSAFFLLVVAGISLPITLFAKNNVAHDLGGNNNTARFYALYLLLIGSLAGMAVTNDLFNVFVLVEVANLSCCGLVSSKNSPRAAKAAFSYLIIASLGSALILGGIGFIYVITGHLNMDFAQAELAKVWQSSSSVVWLAFSFMLVGFGVKTALFPLHIWLPDAHSTAPSPASAVLSGLAIKGYFICYLKILYNVFGSTLMQEYKMHNILTILSIVAIIAASILAIMQETLKRRLAFSTVAQVGYLFLGISFVSTQGLVGALIYLAGHAACKSLLFLSSGVIISATGTEKISELSGIGKKMPLTMAAFTVGSLGLIGIPLFSGFVGKWHLILASLEAGRIIPTAVILAGSVLCAAYLLPIIRQAYFEPISKSDIKDPALPQKIALVLLIAAVLFIGIFPGLLIKLANGAAALLLTA
jgi:multicomponent Na+:H+ antiporter subunit D